MQQEFNWQEQEFQIRFSLIPNERYLSQAF